MAKTKTPRCSICNEPCEPWYPGSDGYGHNAEPINHGRCSNTCNDTLVIPVRMRRIAAGQDAREVRQDHEPQS